MATGDTITPAQDGGDAFTLRREDWGLHRRGQQDQARHQAKVREAIRNNLGDLISDESIVQSDGRHVVKIPIRSLDEYHFRYNQEKRDHGGQGQGGSAVGDVLGQDDSVPGSKGAGAGDEPGLEYYEAEVTVEDIEQALFADLELPFIEPRSPDLLERTDVVFKDVRKKGLAGNIDKRRTLLEAIRRQALAGEAGRQRIRPDDLRFKTWEDEQQPRSQAVVLAMMDTSGSMGLFEKYAARTFFYWMTRFLRSRYESVEMVFIAHHTEARIVTQEAFFTRGESGGTICSSAYRLALDCIAKTYPPSAWNIYPVHFSDGDNLSSDNDQCIRLLGELLEVSNLVGYAEACASPHSGSLLGRYRTIVHPRLRLAQIHQRADVYAALRTMFAPAQAPGGESA